MAGRQGLITSSKRGLEVGSWVLIVGVVDIRLNPASQRVQGPDRQLKVSQVSLEDQALALLVATTPSSTAVEQRSPRSVLKDLANALVGLGRALEVLESADLLADLLTLGEEVLEYVGPRY